MFYWKVSSLLSSYYVLKRTLVAIETIVYTWFIVPAAIQNAYIAYDFAIISCETFLRAKRGELAERTSIREARELLFNVWGLEQGVSRKLSIFDIWCIEQKMFVFTWISKVRHKKIRPGPTRPEPDANWMLISRQIWHVRKKIISQKS